MMIMGTATATFAKNNPGMKHNNKPVATVVAHNNHHNDFNDRDHRHMNEPKHNCFCKHCKKMRHDMEMARKREAEMRRMEAARHYNHPEVNARTGRTAYVGRH